MTTHPNFFVALQNAFPANKQATAVWAEEGLTYSWQDLEDQTARLANLIDSLQLPPSSRIAVQVDKSVEMLMLYLATLRAGHVFLPLNTAYQSSEVDYFLGNATPAVVVCSPANLGWVTPIAAQNKVAHVFTLDDKRQGSLLESAASMASQHTLPGSHPTRWPSSSTPAARQGAARGPCCPTATSQAMPKRSRHIGTGRPMMC